MSIGSTSNSGERRGFPLLWGIYRALGDQTPDLISFRKSAGKGNSEAPPTRWRVLARGTRSGKALPVARPQQVALDMVCSPAAFLSDSNPEPGPSDRLIHHTQPCQEGRFSVSILFGGGRSPDRLRACGHPSWRAEELRADGLPWRPDPDPDLIRTPRQRRLWGR